MTIKNSFWGTKIGFALAAMQVAYGFYDYRYIDFGLVIVFGLIIYILAKRRILGLSPNTILRKMLEPIGFIILLIFSLVPFAYSQDNSSFIFMNLFIFVWSLIAYLLIIFNSSPINSSDSNSSNKI
jgi:hypothetical protein